METTMAILMVLGIFVGIPTLIGLAIAGVYLQSDRRALRAERAKVMEEAAKVLTEQPAKAVAKKPARVA